jgi:hypothetical protein
MAMIPAMSAADFGTGGTAVMNYGMQIGKDLAAYGEKIGLQIKDNRDKQQAMGSLPALQEAMQAFQAGQSGAGYSSIINLAAQDPSNPYVQNLVKLGMMGGTAIDDNRYKMAVAGAKTSTGMDSILPILMLTNPELAKKLSESLVTPTQTDATQATEATLGSDGVVPDVNQPPKDTRSKALKEFQEKAAADEVANNPKLYPEGKLPEAPLSQTQIVTREAYDKNRQALSSGKTFGELIANVDDMVFTPETLSTLKPTYKKISGLDRYLPGVSGMAIIPEESLQLKSMSVSSRGGNSATFANDPEYQKDPKKFLDTVTDAVGKLNVNQGIQDAIKALGGIDKISTVPSGKTGEFKIANLPEGTKPIRIDKDTRDALVLIATLPQAAKNANSPLFGRTDIDIPPPLNKSKEELANML